MPLPLCHFATTLLQLILSGNSQQRGGRESTAYRRHYKSVEQQFLPAPGTVCAQHIGEQLLFAFAFDAHQSIADSIAWY
jgi:hypothetical protein